MLRWTPNGCKWYQTSSGMHSRPIVWFGSCYSRWYICHAMQPWTLRAEWWLTSYSKIGSCLEKWAGHGQAYLKIFWERSSYISMSHTTRILRTRNSLDLAIYMLSMSTSSLFGMRAITGIVTELRHLGWFYRSAKGLYSLLKCNFVLKEMHERSLMILDIPILECSL